MKVGAASGGVFLLGFRLAGCNSDSEPEPVTTAELDAWVRISSDDTVTLLVGKAEMGQGVLTALPMILAEELDADWSKVRSEHAVADADKYGSQLTGGSTSVRLSYDSLRQAGATVREMLKAAAASEWKVAAGECRTENGAVMHDASSRSARYGELAELASTMSVPDSPTLKDRKDFRLIGQSVKRLDSRPKADGTAIFGLDVQRPDMLIAQVAHSPVFGGTVDSFNDSAARAISGVRDVVAIPTGVAVIADHYWAAQQGRDALSIQWNEGANATLSSESILDAMKSGIDDGVEVKNEGDAPAVFDAAVQKLEAEYELPYLAHAAMEPLNCTADVRADACEVWVPTQAQSLTHNLVAQLTGLSKDKVTIHTTMLGGGFGRRAAVDFVMDAVHASKAAGKPVKVVWSREDDVRGGYYRPSVWDKISGSLDESGYPNSWIHKISSPSLPSFVQPPPAYDVTAVEGAENLPYKIANLLVTYKDPGISIPTWFWRSVGSSQNAYVTECFFDELAELGGKDPVEARLHMLADHPRHQRVVQLAADQAGWGGTLPEGVAQGVAVHESFGSIVAQVADVSIGDGGAVNVHRVVCAVDCGEVINPNTIEAQMESAIVYGLSAALYGQVRIENGRAVEGNFNTYQVLRMSEMPEIAVHIVAEGDPIGGIGEPGLPPIAPAVCNALYKLTGTRIRKLPIGRIS
ncbi:MAG: xanthine dehydrogenase family protein molybdopterin-binding subunit [Proteobacteria bacterium]|nr:xanthine dehydrogenase family protein molybdopterin-binding subunit [Pseudomonadota bacterium]